MSDRPRLGPPPLAAWDVFRPLHELWWTALGVPLAGVLHGLVILLAVYPVTLVIGPYGLAVVALTVLVRLVLVPLALWQLRGALRAREKAAVLQARLEPQLAALRRRYRQQPAKLRQETAKLLGEHGADPLATAASGLWASLVPALVQLPVLIALYAVIGGLAGAPGLAADLHFLWIPSVTAADPIVLPVLIGVATWLAGLLAQRRPLAPQEKDAARAQRQLSFLYPLVIVVMAHFAPAALALYWLTSTLFGLVQQAAANRLFIPRLAAS